VGIKSDEITLALAICAPMVLGNDRVAFRPIEISNGWSLFEMLFLLIVSYGLARVYVWWKRKRMAVTPPA
jgi:hypothetical protein